MVGQLAARLGEQGSALDMADSSTLGDEPMRRSELHVTPNADCVRLPQEGLQHGSCTQTLQFCAAFWPSGALSSRI